MDAANTVRRSRDLLTVDLQGLKIPLVAHCAARGVSPSEFVRRLLREAMALEPSDVATAARAVRPTSSDRVRLTIRLRRQDADALADRARRAGLSQSSYLAGLVVGIPVLADGSSCLVHAKALAASNAELVLLTTSLNHLVLLLSRGSVGPALEYRRTIETLVPDVRRHLALAAGVVSDLQPRHRAVRSQP